MSSTLLLLLLEIALFVELLHTASITQECIQGTGTDYRGEEQVTSTGERCLNWMATKRDYKVNLHPDNMSGVGNHSFCRNPDKDKKTWCYVDHDGVIKRQFCAIQVCKGSISEVTQLPTVTSQNSSTSEENSDQLFETDDSGSRSEAAAVQPVIGISQRMKLGPKQKKDLGPLGYALGVIMMVIIILIGVGITVGYIYKRGRDLKRRREQEAYEREMQRITLPLSAFTNPTCEIMDENTVIVHTNQTPVDETEGSNPLIEQAGTPGA
ncbi:phosphoinositide-3-kinase-interacting protein 1 [Protopterus annectens]|uniref:phosphoinositide-3-kinase-interacting protein 1 n=1 Tax=Protopterus annectens TaxID=7888 RepID=UPI001CFC40CB|nr:phosphoinositide-3-kinase-interacting protein 1 [Protopterus annectens]